MKIHILSGDSLVGPFENTRIEGEKFVCRECMVDGDLGGEGLEEFWETRRKFLLGAYPDVEHDYSSDVVDQFAGMWNAADGNEVNLWFEYELFCQANLWFTVWLLRNTDARFRIVYPKIDTEDDIWKGFAGLDEGGLKRSFEDRISMSHDDVFLAVGLWESFKDRDWDTLSELGKTETKAFPTLKQVTKAACEIETRPKESLDAIIEEVGEDFSEIFRLFGEREAVYGFGDLQVKRLLSEGS